VTGHHARLFTATGPGLSPDARVSLVARSKWLFPASIARTVDSRVSPEIATCVPASFFDVDGTLVRTNLVHPTLYYLANQANPLRSLAALGRAVARAPRMVVAEAVDRRLFNELLFASYEGMSRDRLMLLADEVFDRVIRRAIYPGARELVQRCSAEGHDVVIVSGALDFLMGRLAEHLGATAVIANRLEYKNGYATGRLARPIVAGPEKAKLVREWAKEHGHDLTDCFAYSDSYSDVPMLSVVGRPCAVNPDLRLAKLARTYSWPVVHLGKRPPWSDLLERIP
jgi:HAD superfamily hydrolase (TIGR01490 family)